MSSPKEQFRGNKDLVSGFNDIVDSRQMTAAFDAAMLQLQYSLGIPDDQQKAAANAFRLQGAAMYLATLKTLNSAPPPPPPKPNDNLTQT